MGMDVLLEHIKEFQEQLEKIARSGSVPQIDDEAFESLLGRKVSVSAHYRCHRHSWGWHCHLHPRCRRIGH